MRSSIFKSSCIASGLVIENIVEEVRLVGGNEEQQPDQGLAREAALGGGGVVARRGFRRQTQAGRHRVAKGEPEALRLAMHIVGRRGDQRIFGDTLGAEPLPYEKAEPRDAGAGPGGFFAFFRA